MIDSIKNILITHNIDSDYKLKKINSGTNNKVYLVYKKNKKYILKIFLNKKRFIKEKIFLEYINNISYPYIPQIIDSNCANKSIITSYLPGSNVKKLTKKKIIKIIDFIKNINQNINYKHSKKIEFATDYCDSLIEHINLVEKKLNQFKLLNNKNDLNIKVINFIDTKIKIIFNKYKKEIYKNLEYKKLKKKYDKNYYILSPSDFNFKNIIEFKSNLYFYDFEYSGKDDPLKLILDFCCQPDFFISKNHKNFFLIEFIKQLNLDDQLYLYFNYFLKLNHIKWCLILLNSFNKNVKKRRIHSGILNENYLENQLKKAINYFNLNLI